MERAGGKTDRGLGVVPPEGPSVVASGSDIPIPPMQRGKSDIYMIRVRLPNNTETWLYRHGPASSAARSAKKKGQILSVRKADRKAPGPVTPRP